MKIGDLFSRLTLVLNEYIYNVTFRCQCGHCVAMRTEEESSCCLEAEEIQCTMDEPLYPEEGDGGFSCITEHPGFQQVCLARFALDCAYLQYRQEHGVWHGTTNRYI